MTNYHTGKKFDFEYQDALHQYADDNNLSENLWIDARSLERDFNGLAYPKTGATGMLLELHREEVGVKLQFYNFDEIVNKSVVIEELKKRNSHFEHRNFLTGLTYSFRVQGQLLEAARKRKFKSSYWVDANNMRDFQPALELREHDDGVVIEVRKGQRTVLYNMDQIRNSKFIISSRNRHE
eukprot:CAMPEP_0201543834 /NCGR_PEP_ID=MMETSP0161_2-20130828/72830_1 /ASSEMBLY_ACC=CAM_ASM_000251 /TAXON_ID=180227 /ORGANISM="Neoparamoeba aestuarina, Strain SoJaBio B1-5/56/2" /LENGTH=180 /DNA_ID=CAMNT_0047951681 /DNA_START=655 /DNA_END=1197 /DNA_ORIENTATION=+